MLVNLVAFRRVGDTGRRCRPGFRTSRGASSHLHGRMHQMLRDPPQWLVTYEVRDAYEVPRMPVVLYSCFCTGCPFLAPPPPCAMVSVFATRSMKRHFLGTVLSLFTGQGCCFPQVLAPPVNLRREVPLVRSYDCGRAPLARSPGRE